MMRKIYLLKGKQKASGCKKIEYSSANVLKKNNIAKKYLKKIKRNHTQRVMQLNWRRNKKNAEILHTTIFTRYSTDKQPDTKCMTILNLPSSAIFYHTAFSIHPKTTFFKQVKRRLKWQVSGSKWQVSGSKWQIEYTSTINHQADYQLFTVLLWQMADFYKNTCCADVVSKRQGI